jgi:nucleotide-binding universal stress UspA family protein
MKRGKVRPSVQAQVKSAPLGEARPVYKRILLAYDGSLEGRAALREGALLAHSSGAEVFLLSVVEEGFGLLTAEAIHAGAVSHVIKQSQAILEAGLALLSEAGIPATGKLVSGEPTQVIAGCARQIGADLVVVSHRKRSLVERWWSGSSGAYLAEQLTCSLLIARNP